MINWFLVENIITGIFGFIAIVGIGIIMGTFILDVLFSEYAGIVRRERRQNCKDWIKRRFIHFDSLIEELFDIANGVRQPTHHEVIIRVSEE